MDHHISNKEICFEHQTWGYGCTKNKYKPNMLKQNVNNKSSDEL